MSQEHRDEKNPVLEAMNVKRFQGDPETIRVHVEQFVNTGQSKVLSFEELIKNDAIVQDIRKRIAMKYHVNVDEDYKDPELNFNLKGVTLKDMHLVGEMAPSGTLFSSVCTKVPSHTELPFDQCIKRGENVWRSIFDEQCSVTYNNVQSGPDQKRYHSAICLRSKPKDYTLLHGGTQTVPLITFPGENSPLNMYGGGVFNNAIKDNPEEVLHLHAISHLTNIHGPGHRTPYLTEVNFYDNGLAKKAIVVNYPKLTYTDHINRNTNPNKKHQTETEDSQATAEEATRNVLGLRELTNSMRNGSMSTFGIHLSYKNKFVESAQVAFVLELDIIPYFTYIGEEHHRHGVFAHCCASLMDQYK